MNVIPLTLFTRVQLQAQERFLTFPRQNISEREGRWQLIINNGQWTIKAFLISGILLLAAVLTVIFFAFNGGENEESRVSITTTGEVDFDSGTAHTADAGIAVISNDRLEQIPADLPPNSFDTTRIIGEQLSTTTVQLPLSKWSKIKRINRKILHHNPPADMTLNG